MRTQLKWQYNYNTLTASGLYKSPQLALFLRHGGDFIGYLLGGELDVVHEGLLGLVPADVHHLEDGVLVAEVHVRYAGASGSVTRHTFVARHDDIAVEVGFRLNLVAVHGVFLLHCELGRHFL